MKPNQYRITILSNSERVMRHRGDVCFHGTKDGLPLTSLIEGRLWVIVSRDPLNKWLQHGSYYRVLISFFSFFFFTEASNKHSNHPVSLELKYSWRERDAESQACREKRLEGEQREEVRRKQEERSWLPGPAVGENDPALPVTGCSPPAQRGTLKLIFFCQNQFSCLFPDTNLNPEKIPALKIGGN